MNEERLHMIRMQEEIYQTYQMRPVRAPYNTLFDLLEKHGLGRLARMFATARTLDLPRPPELNAGDVMMYDEWDENGVYNYSTAIYHLRPGRTFFAGPGCKPILLKSSWMRADPSDDDSDDSDDDDDDDDDDNDDSDDSDEQMQP
jgi:hypothetical protein